MLYTVLVDLDETAQIVKFNDSLKLKLEKKLKLLSNNLVLQYSIFLIIFLKQFFCYIQINCNYILFINLPWPGDSEWS